MVYLLSNGRDRRQAYYRLGLLKTVFANERQISVIGLSLGGVVGSIAMGIEPRMKTGCFLSMAAIRQNDANEQCFQIRQQIPSARQQVPGKSKELCKLSDGGKPNRALRMLHPLQRTYLIDPLTYAPMLKGRPLLMINARWDKCFQQENSSDFWKACGECERVILPATHASIWIWYPSYYA